MLGNILDPIQVISLVSEAFGETAVINRVGILILFLVKCLMSYHNLLSLCLLFFTLSMLL